MAVLEFKETTDNREGSINSLYQGVYRRSFRVRLDSSSAGPRAAMNAAGMPALGDVYTNGLPDTDPYYEADPYAFCVGKSAKCKTANKNPDHAAYDVTVEYGPYDAALFGNNPVDWPIKVAFSAANYERIVWIDQAGNAVVNSAGDPFREPLKADDSRPVLTVTRAERVDAFSFTLANEFRDAVNDATWNGFDAGVVRCRAIDTNGDPQWNAANGYWYYLVRYVFELNRDGWRAQVLDQGYAHLVSSVRTAILGDDGQRVDEPRMLDGAGGLLDDGDPPVTLEFIKYPELDFGTFNLDLSAALGK